MERIQHLHCLGQLLSSCGFKAGEPVHRDHFNALLPVLVLLSQPGLEHGFGAAWNHIQQPCSALPFPDRGEVNDHRDVLVCGAGMPPYVLVNTEDFDSVEAGGIVEEQALAFAQYCVVGGVPGDAEAFGNPGNGQVLADQCGQGPTEAGPADFLALCRRLG